MRGGGTEREHNSNDDKLGAGRWGEPQKGIDAADSCSGVTQGHAQEALAKSKSCFHLQMQQPEH